MSAPDPSLAQRLEEAFWAAADLLGDDDSVHGMEQPYFDQEMSMVDTSGTGLPDKFWQHMAAWWEANGKW